jgi:mRNA interferase RelE/StbE
LIYTIKIKPTALEELDRVPSHILKRATEAINNLSLDPRPRGCKKLAGETNLWRVRVSEYRIVYEIDDFQKLIRVRRVLHRKEAYR